MLSVTAGVPGAGVKVGIDPLPSLSSHREE